MVWMVVPVPLARQTVKPYPVVPMILVDVYVMPVMNRFRAFAQVSDGSDLSASLSILIYNCALVYAIECNITSYKVAVGNSNCLSCPANTASLTTGALVITSCVPIAGYYGTTGGVSPQPCPFGSYKSTTGLSSSCTVCSASAPSLTDSPMASIAAVNCNCVGGYVGSSGSCSACPASTFMANAGTSALGPSSGSAFPPSSCFACALGSTSMVASTSCTCSAGSCSTALNETMVIYPLNDTTIYNDASAATDTTEQYLSLREGDNFGVGRRRLLTSTNTQRAFLLFDLLTLPAVAWSRVVLRLFQANTEWAAIGVNVWAASSTEWIAGNGISWATRPSLIGTSQIARVQLRSDLSSSYGAAIDFDVSPYIRTQQSLGTRYIVLALIADNDTTVSNIQQFASIDHIDPAVHPTLVVQYEPAVSIVEADTSIVPTTSLLSDSSAGEPFLRLSPWTQSTAYLRFNIATAPTSYTSAWLRIIALPTPFTQGITVGPLLNNSWDEFTQASLGPTIANGSIIGTLPGLPNPVGWVTRLLDMTSYLQSLPVDTTAVSLLVTPLSGGIRPFDFASREYTDTRWLPRLYYCACNSHSDCTYDDITGVKCTSCLHNTTGQFCEACIAGYGGSAIINTCIACSLGTYKSTLDNIDCIACPTNTSTMMTASTMVTNCMCQPGSTGINGGICSLCAESTYKSTYGSDSCVSCPLYAVSTIGSVNATDCKCMAGFLQNGPGGECVDINECDTSNGGCGSANICLNSPGGYTCLPVMIPSTYAQVLTGFTGSGSSGTMIADSVNGGQLLSASLNSGSTLDYVTSDSATVDVTALVPRGFITLNNAASPSIVDDGQIITVNISIAWGECDAISAASALVYYTSNITWITSTDWEMTFPPGTSLLNPTIFSVYKSDDS
jgi:hypothetical protein